MLLSLKEIKRLRKKFGLTQSQLAKAANVSQSLIAKVEAGTLDPTYSKAMKIISTLNDIQHKEELKAKDIMTKRVVTVRPDDKIQNVVRLMKRYGISQMPVVEKNAFVGMVSESDILDAVIEGRGKEVRDIMEDVPPILAKNASSNLISQLLKDYPLILVADKGKLEGVITKSNIIDTISH